jgi:hypothetical protein
MKGAVDFVLRWIEASGGLAEEAGPDLWHVAPAAAPVGFEGLGAVTGEIETAREEPGAELVAPGSPLLDAVAREARGAGRSARVFLAGLDPDHPATPGRAFRFDGAAASVIGARAFEHRLVLFTFHLLYESDEREEDLVAVGVDQCNGRILRRAAEAAAATSFTEERTEAWPLAPLLPMERALAIARGELLHRVSAAITARRTLLDGLLRDEAGRTARYYEDLCDEIETARTERTPAEIAERLAATRREKAGRLADLADKYRLRVSASLAGVLIVIQPKTRVSLRIAPEKGPPAALEVFWDPLLIAYEAADCPGCGKPGFSFEVVHGEGRLRCPLCPRRS